MMSSILNIISTEYAILAIGRSLYNKHNILDMVWKNSEFVKKT